MMTSWKCYECEGYNLFETSLVRINRLSFLIDDEDDVLPMPSPKCWCDDCDGYVIAVEADKPLYKEI
jgi:hypothetical protein